MTDVMETLKHNPSLFWKKVNKTDGCWDWIGANNGNGYGQFRRLRAHRISFQLAHGSIPAGYVVDHICRNRSCVNPCHLRLVTLRINTLENSESLTAKNAVKTHCKNGHEFTPENTYINPRPYRECLTCRRKNDLARWHSKRKKSALEQIP